MSIGVNANISSADLATQTTGTKTITKPTGTVTTAGSADLLVLSWGVFEGSSTDTLSTPTGWTLQANVDAGNVRLWVFTALGGVAATGFTFTGSSTDLGWVCVGFTGVDNTTPVDASGTSSTSSGSTTVTANAVTIATLNAIEVICGCDVNDGAMSATGFTTKDNGSTLHMRPAILYNLTGQALGSTGTVTVTNGASATSQQLAVFPFALRPAAGGATETYPAGHGGSIRQAANTLLRMRRPETDYALDIPGDWPARGWRPANRDGRVVRSFGPGPRVAFGTGQRSRRARAARRRLEAAGHDRP